MSLRQEFIKRLGQTSTAPIALEITHAEGNYLYNKTQKWLDLIGGISVCNIGHNHPHVKDAIIQQVHKHLHVMVYGELVQSPQVEYAQKLIELLGAPFEAVYFVNSGSEAVEAAMKLAKRVTGRPHIFAFNKSYHGSSQGALSIIGDEYWRNAYRPLLPGIYHFDYNHDAILDEINKQTAAVIIEPIQAENGVVEPDVTWLKTLRQKCTETNTLLIFDEIQTGFGRTGHWFAFQKYNIVPDIILLGKALGGGMPLGAVISKSELLNQFSQNPVLGHITTFGGHPVSCAAGLACVRVLEKEPILQSILEKEKFLKAKLAHPKIIQTNVIGCWAAVFFDNQNTCLEICQKLIENGYFTDWFLFAQNALRISPPLTITLYELESFTKKLLALLD